MRLCKRQKSPNKRANSRDDANPNGQNRYEINFAKDQVPPVRGFWSLTLYDQYHFFHSNSLNRYSLGTKNRTLNVQSR